MEWIRPHLLDWLLLNILPILSFLMAITWNRGFPGGSVNKESTYNAGDQGSIPGSGRSSGEGNGYPFWYSCLENFIDRGAWWLQSKGSQRVRHDLVTNSFTKNGELVAEGINKNSGGRTFSPMTWFPGSGEGAESSTNGQWFHQSCLCNEATTKVQRSGFREFLGWWIRTCPCAAGLDPKHHRDRSSFVWDLASSAFNILCN